MAIHGLEPMAQARSVPANARQSSVCRISSIAGREGTWQVLRGAIARLVLACASQPSAVRHLPGRWWRTRQALAGKPHAPREAARVHPAAGGAADARALVARAAVHARRSRGAAAMNRWRPTAALAAIVLFGSLLAWRAEARILVCWWEYPGRMCTIIKSAKSTLRPEWVGNGHRRAPPPCPRGFWAVCGECPC